MQKENNPKQLDDLKIELKAKVEDVVNNFRSDPAKIAEYLQFAARFSSYSHNNVRLIYAQNPYARYIAPASRFFAGLPDESGVKLSETPILIKKWERALRIWAPTDRKYVLDPDKQRWIAFSYLSERLQKRAAAESWETRTRTDFVLVPVFDVSQTETPRELYPKLLAPGYADVSADIRYNAIKSYAENELHCRVIVGDMGAMENAAFGYFSPDRNEIHISSRIEGNAKLSTLIHELGHAELHAAADPAKSTAQIELEADMYAILVQEKMGVPLTDERKSHLARHYTEYLEEVKSAQPDIQLDLKSDSAPFDSVLRRYGDQADKLDEYVLTAGREIEAPGEVFKTEASLSVESSQFKISRC